jgi:hypothetical protein
VLPPEIMVLQAAGLFAYTAHSKQANWNLSIGDEVHVNLKMMPYF